MTKSKIAFRPYALTDFGFITKSWLKGWFHAPTNFGMHKHVYYKTAEVYIKDTLKRAGAVMACDPNSPNELYGFISAEYLDNETIMHWIYVKHNLRGLGIGGALFNYANKSTDQPFSTSYCPHYEDLDELYRKGKTRDQISALYNQIQKELTKPPKIKLVDPDGREIGLVHKNSMIYLKDKLSSRKDKYKVIYSPLLIARLHKCNTTPIATLIT